MFTIPTLKQALLAVFVAVLFAAACSSDGGRGDQLVLPDTTDAPSTTVDATPTSVEPSTTVVDETTTTHGHTHDEPSTTATDVDGDRLTYDEIAEFIEETNPTLIVGEDVVNEDGSIGSSVTFDTLPPHLLPEPVVVTVPPTTVPPTTVPPTTVAPTTVAPTTVPPTTVPPTTEPTITVPTTVPPTTVSTTTVPTTTTVWREATARIPVEAVTTYVQEDPLLHPDTDLITYGASEPMRLEPGMRLVTDITTRVGHPLDGAWIIGILKHNNSYDEITMFVCIEGVFHEGSTQNLVVPWDVARGETEGVYQVLYQARKPDGTYLPWVIPYTSVRWEERAARRRSFTNLIDVSECW